MLRESEEAVLKDVDVYEKVWPVFSITLHFFLILIKYWCWDCYCSTFDMQVSIEHIMGAPAFLSEYCQSSSEVRIFICQNNLATFNNSHILHPTKTCYLPPNSHSITIPLSSE